MRQVQTLGALLGITLLLFAADNVAQAGRSITFVGVETDVTDFQTLEFGQEGFYFPKFDASSAVTQRPTWEDMVFSSPSWAGFQFDITQADRTFSVDAGFFSGDTSDPLDQVAPFGDPLVFGVYSEGGDTAWDTWTLPNGTTGLSGSVVDEFTAGNSNNSVNRIQLGAGVPSSFVLRIAVDNTNNEHDPAGRLRARGSDSAGNDLSVKLTGLTFNGITDVYSFRYDNFVATDFIKIQLNSGVGPTFNPLPPFNQLTPGLFAGFGGLMFDVAVPEPSSIVLSLLGFLGLVGYGVRRRS